ACQIDQGGMRQAEQRFERAAATVHVFDETPVSASGSRPMVLEIVSGAFEIEEYPYGRPIRRVHFVEMGDWLEIERRDVHLQSFEGPLQSRAIEQDVRTAVERDAVRGRAAGEAASLPARLEYVHVMTKGRQARRRRQSADAGANDGHSHRGR